ncbi:23S rRNA (guanosine(2251)-2'-O)-methyltransferase RlmB [Candidatus Tachikawaea gelatinosa]|uniref:23S rRNA (Guanosine-2'-O-)-methyltransferase n=1 Tax=Candidatus Tachikawaea gelatinosa TaxID=1410383 RepID=A0A090ARC0_9ENTR|nr:23S rRNA (guanosine(2251)-2'-O)-methyltransferase RlmB [Candidatus Tachikawaea gelatinosa]BAP58300.1 23S rRNA (guanosine-2'-O-)-methyltransferase [Candidatus Tachikawaea gelatinosa]
MFETVFGIHQIFSLLKKNPDSIKEIFCIKKNNSRRVLLINELKKHNININKVDNNWFKKFKNCVHQGLVAYVKPSISLQEKDLYILLKKIKNPFLLILDSITDPHNLGACLRSAEAAGVDVVIIPKKRSAKINATVKKTSCGTTENIAVIRVTNIVHTISLLKDYNIQILGSDSEADQLFYNTKMNGPLALVMGSEDKGIRSLVKKNCDVLLSIPIVGKVSSLNVSVATGILLFEILKQRTKTIINNNIK